MLSLFLMYLMCVLQCAFMFVGVKDRIVKQNLIRAVELIGQAMHPSHLKTNFSFSQRNGLLQHMKVGITDVTLFDRALWCILL